MLIFVLFAINAASAEQTVTKPLLLTQSRTSNLTSDTPINTIESYQLFFSNKSNFPQIQRTSPTTLYMWQNMSRIINSEMILRDGTISKLDVNINPTIDNIRFTDAKSELLTVGDFFNKYPLDSLIVIQNGIIISEKYKTMRSFDKHNWFSVGKIASSTMISLLEEQKKVNVKYNVSFYLPELRNSVWDTVPVIDVLNMATGLNSTEHEEHDARINPERGWFQWATAMGLFKPSAGYKDESPFDVLTRMKRVKPGNTAFEYNSINTWVLELIVERITGKPFGEAFGDAVWRKIGAQADGYIGITPNGYPMGWGFISSNLRDLARVGVIFTPSWNKVAKEQIISQKMISKIQHSGNPNNFTKGSVGGGIANYLNESGLSNSYQWDIVFPDGDLFKSGVGGQGLYVSPSRDLVIAWFSTGENKEYLMSRAIALSGLFQNKP